MSRLDHILSAWERNPDSIVGTLVDLAGSGYRRPGARIVIARDGQYTGAISGGCLERDVARHAWSFVEDGPQTVALDTRASEMHPHGYYGTGCDGVVEVLLRPPSDSTEALMEAIADTQARGVPAVVAHVYDDTTPNVGSFALWHEPDRVAHRHGPGVNLGALEDAVQQAFESQRSLIVERSTPDGSARIFVEYLAPPLDLLVVGSGHDVEALVEVATPLGWAIRVASTNAVKLKNFDVKTHLLETPHRFAEVELSERTRVVIMTHDFEMDVAVLSTLLSRSHRPWLGILGPSRRTARLMTTLIESGTPPDTQFLDALVSPVGLDLGAEDPWEVATSIVSQIIAHSRSRDGGDLSDRGAPIHDSISRLSVSSEKGK